MKDVVDGLKDIGVTVGFEGRIVEFKVLNYKMETLFFKLTATTAVIVLNY